MPSLFDQISGFTFPDVLMNSGPLPSTAGGPAGSDGSIDGVINGTSALLGNITPYAVGKSARTGSDRNYQQIPHRYPYIIPKIWLPDFYTDRHIPVSHAVDQGDIAFLLYGGSRAWWTSKEQFATRAPQCAFAGIDVVNYILACLQMSTTRKWQDIRRDLLLNDTELYDAIDRYALQKSTNGFDQLLLFHAVRVLVQQYFVPHGICAGSEKQGGQHEHDGGQPVIAPVNFVITMTVDGKNIDLVNYWYGKSMLAGDELIFRLKKETVKRTFTLSSYYKDPQMHAINTDRECWQLVPDLLRHDPLEKDRDVCTNATAWRHHQCQGYWRIAQTFQTRAKNNIHAFTRGTPLEVTFAPVWQSFGDCRDVSSYGTHKVLPTVTRFGSGTPIPLLSLATKNKMTFFYDTTEPDKFAFEMKSSQRHYKIRFNDKVCKVYADGADNHIVNGAEIDKSRVTCLHVFFDRNVSNVSQSHKAHIPKTTQKTPYGQGDSTVHEKIQATVFYKQDIAQHAAVSTCGEYLVTLLITQETDGIDLYDSDFFRVYPKNNWQVLGGNCWRKIHDNYELATERQAFRVEYVQKSSSSSSFVSTGFTSAGAARSNARPSSAPSGRTRVPGDLGEEMNTDASLMHAADITDIGALQADASADTAPDLAPTKPQKRMKKIKFLEPDTAAADAAATE